MSNAPKLVHVTRLDSFPAFKASYTDEGYLRDKPVLTSTGIFEYRNDDGSIRRELRLPEEVFAPESLASYKGKPVVITHDAGLITSDNVADNQIGTILTEGEKSGEDVRAEIVIHDTDALKECRFKELSLGYNLDLEETPGVWKGQKYDAIQRNIRVNHLAIVREARAGDQARLNIDSRADKTIMTGGHKTMAKRKAVRSVVRNDGILSPEELQKAIAEYKARRAAEKTDGDDQEKLEQLAEQEVVKPQEKVGTEPPAADPAEKKEELAKGEEPASKPEPVQLPDQNKPVEEKINAVKSRRDLRDEKGDPENVNGAMEQIAEQDEDIGYLIDIIDTLLAERDFAMNQKAAEKGKTDSADEGIPDADEGETAVKENLDGEGCEDKDIGADEADDPEEEIPAEEGGEDDFEDEEDDSADEYPVPEEEAEETEDDEEEEEIPARLNEDSVDEIVRKQLRVRMSIAKIGARLNMDGLEYMPIARAKKKIIQKVRPGIRLDGKSEAYVNVLYQLCVDDVKRSTRKDTAYQRRQMFPKAFNQDSNTAADEDDSAESRRQKMIDRQSNRQPERYAAKKAESKKK